MNKTKVCKKCGEEKDITLFVKNKNCKDGYENRCKECKNKYLKQYNQENKEEVEKYRKQYYQENKEGILEQKKQYYKENKEEIAKYQKQYNQENKEKVAKYKKQYREENKEYYQEYKKQYREENKEEILEQKKQYYQENKEEISKKQKQYYQENKEEISKKQKQYRKENPHIKFNNHNKRRSKEEQQGKGIDGKQWFEMMKFFDFKCAYSGEYLGGNNEDGNRTIDHILCLDNGGLNEIWNVVPMYRNYNSSKNKSNPMNWYKEQEYYSEDRLNKIIEWQIYAYEKWATEDDEDLILIVDII